jgi:nicotinate-nucleotide adenylyltransferase
MKKIGLYGGSFDPIHFGHLNLAFELMEKRELDEVWFIPAQLSPHKLHTEPSSFEHRVNMLRLALEPVSSFVVNEIEKKMPVPSFTVNTVRAIISMADSAHQFYLLLGEDSALSFSSWHQPEELVKMIPLLVGSRSLDLGSVPYSTALELNTPLVKKAIRNGMVTTRLIDISSTELRDRVFRKAYCGHLIPHKVLQYIERHSLYAEKKE